MLICAILYFLQAQAMVKGIIAFVLLFVIYTNPVAREQTVNILNGITSYVQNLPMPKSD